MSGSARVRALVRQLFSLAASCCRAVHRTRLQASRRTPVQKIWGDVDRLGQISTTVLDVDPSRRVGLAMARHRPGSPTQRRSVPWLQQRLLASSGYARPEIFRVTVAPFSTEVPAVGVESITTPGCTFSEGSETRSAAKPVAFNMASASSMVRPTRAGTVTRDGGSGRAPVEIFKVTVEPFSTEVPAVGVESITSPGWIFSEGSLIGPVPKPVAFNMACASSAVRPVRAGTVTSGTREAPLDTVSKTTEPKCEIVPGSGACVKTWSFVTELGTRTSLVPNWCSSSLIACCAGRPTTLGTRTLDMPLGPAATVRTTVEPRGLLSPGEGDWASTRRRAP